MGNTEPKEVTMESTNVASVNNIDLPVTIPRSKVIGIFSPARSGGIVTIPPDGLKPSLTYFGSNYDISFIYTTRVISSAQYSGTINAYIKGGQGKDLQGETEIEITIILTLSQELVKLNSLQP